MGPSDDFWTEQYKKAGEWVLLWQYAARDLICAANVLYRRERSIPWETKKREGDRPHIYHTSISIVLMLYALALENLLKGLLVAQGTDATSTGRLNPALKTHRLRELCRAADVATSSGEAALLGQLQHLIESGKYPFGVGPIRELGKMGIVIPTDINQTLAIIARVDDLIRKAQPETTLAALDLGTLCVEDCAG